MTSQDELFHEDWRDALRHAVSALGGFEAVGIEIWPAKSRAAAGRWLSDCLNPERPAKLDLEEIEAILRMGREHSVHAGLHILCDRIDYERPRPCAAKSRETLILEEKAVIARREAELSRELDEIRGRGGSIAAAS